MTIQFYPYKVSSLRSIFWAPPDVTALLKKVDAIWAAEKKERPLYNGLIFCVTAHSEHCLEGAFVPYKFLLAQMKDKKIASQLQLRPLGVSGIVVRDQEILIGKRSAAVSQHKYYFECLPSGSIEKGFSPERQIIKELREETGIEKKNIVSCKLLGLFYSPYSRNFDLGYRIHVKKVSNIELSKEYSRIEWMDKSVWKKLLSSQQRMVPLSRALLQRFIL